MQAVKNLSQNLTIVDVRVSYLYLLVFTLSPLLFHSCLISTNTKLLHGKSINSGNHWEYVRPFFNIMNECVILNNPLLQYNPKMVKHT